MYAIRYKELVKKDEGINNNMEKKRDQKNKLRGKWLRGIIIHFRYDTEESAYVDFICNRIGIFLRELQQFLQNVVSFETAVCQKI